MRYISGVNFARKSPQSLMNANSVRQTPKRRSGRRNLSEWRDRQFYQRAACLWALKVVFEENADASDWHDQINTALVREITGDIKASGLAAPALAVAAYDCAGGSTRAKKGSVRVDGVSSPAKVLPLSRRMVCYWRASVDYQRATELILRETGRLRLRKAWKPENSSPASSSTEISDYEMEVEMRKEMAREMFTRLR